MTTYAQRQHLRDLMYFLWLRRAQIHYLQRRPMRSVFLSESQLKTLLRAGHGLAMDCSEAVTALCKWAGLRDPNNRHYDGQGWTGTLLSSLPHYHDPSVARAGALVVFGSYPGHHVAMVYAHGSDPLLWSQGQESDPRFIRFSAERASQARPYTFLSIARL